MSCVMLGVSVSWEQITHQMLEPEAVMEGNSISYALVADKTDPPYETAHDRETLYASLQALVRRLVHKYGDDPQLREELPNEIYLRFCILLQAYDPARKVPLQAYLISQLERSIYTYVRRHWHVRRREVGYDVNLDTSVFMQAIDPTCDWDEQLLRQQLRRHLPALLSQLTRQQRHVVLMRYYEGRSFQDIAQRMNFQQATARSTLRYALNRLRSMLEFIDMM